MLSRRTPTRRAATLVVASAATASALILGAASAVAAPETTATPETSTTPGTTATPETSATPATPTPKTTPINVEQTPNIGISIAGIPMPFAAALTAEAVEATPASDATPTDGDKPDAATAVTRLALDPAADACGTNLRNSKVGVTVTNKSTGKTINKTFPACVDNKPSAGVDVPTGTGKISFTTSIVGQGNKTFSVVPGSGSFTR